MIIALRFTLCLPEPSTDLVMIIAVRYLVMIIAVRFTFSLPELSIDLVMIIAVRFTFSMP